MYFSHACDSCCYQHSHLCAHVRAFVFSWIAVMTTGIEGKIYTYTTHTKYNQKKQEDLLPTCIWQALSETRHNGNFLETSEKKSWKLLLLKHARNVHWNRSDFTSKFITNLAVVTLSQCYMLDGLYRIESLRSGLKKIGQFTYSYY